MQGQKRTIGWILSLALLVSTVVISIPNVSAANSGNIAPLGLSISPLSPESNDTITPRLPEADFTVTSYASIDSVEGLYPAADALDPLKNLSLGLDSVPSQVRASSWSNANGHPTSVFTGERSNEWKNNDKSCWTTHGGTDHQASGEKDIGLAANLGGIKQFDTVLINIRPNNFNGNIDKLTIEVSSDGDVWSALNSSQTNGTWPETGSGWELFADTTPESGRSVYAFQASQPVSAQYVRLNIHKAVEGNISQVLVNSFEVYDNSGAPPLEPVLTLSATEATYTGLNHVSVDVDLAGYTLESVGTLAMDSDYTVEGLGADRIKITFEPDYLNAIIHGQSDTLDLTFTKAGEANEVREFLVSAALTQPSLPDTATIAKNSNAEITASYGAYPTIVSIKQGEQLLSAGNEYTISGSVITLDSSLFSGLSSGDSLAFTVTFHRDGQSETTKTTVVYIEAFDAPSMGYATMNDYIAGGGYSNAEAADSGVNLARINPSSTAAADRDTFRSSSIAANNANGSWPQNAFNGSRDDQPFKNNSASSWATHSSDHNNLAPSRNVGLAVNLGQDQQFDTIVVHAGNTASPFSSSGVSQLTVDTAVSVDKAFTWDTLPTSNTEARWSGATASGNAPAILDIDEGEWALFGNAYDNTNAAIGGGNSLVYVFKSDTPVTAQFLRLSLTAHAGGALFVNSFEVYNSKAGGPSLSSGGASFTNIEGAENSPVTTEYTLNGTSLDSITYQDTPLTNAEYTESGNTVTFKESWMKTLAEGRHWIHFTFGDGTVLPYRLSVVVPQSGSLSEYSGRYDLTLKNSLGVAVTTPRNNLLKDITVNGSKLENSNYFMAAADSAGTSLLTFMPYWLDSLSQGTHTISFVFQNGAPQDYTLTVLQSPGGALLPATGSYKRPIRNTVSTTLRLGGTATLTEILDPSSAPVSTNHYTVNGTTVTFSPAYMDTLADGKHIFTFNFSAGVSQTFTLRVSDVSTIDYSIWSLQAPIEGTGYDFPTSKLLSREYTDWWYHGTDEYAGYDMFATPKEGRGTPNSSYTRAELRELLPGGSGTAANWNRMGYHRMELEVKRQPLSSVTGRQRVSVAQVWGAVGPSNSAAMFELFYEGDGGFVIRPPSTGGGNWKVYKSADTSAENLMNIPIGEAFGAVFEVVDGKLTVWITNEAGVETQLWFQSGSNPAQDSLTLDVNNNSTWYFKAGNYDQDSKKIDNILPDPTDINAVVGFRTIEVVHNPISGRLTLEDGTPLSGKEVQYTMTGGGLPTPATLTATTDDTGQYFIPNVPYNGNSTAKVVITPPSIAGATPNTTAITVPSRTGAISGVVTEQDFVYAEKGTEVTYFTITLDANGGTVSPTTLKTTTQGKLPSLPTPTKTDGSTFNGWFSSPAGGTEITTNTVFSHNAIVYAQWTPKQPEQPEPEKPIPPVQDREESSSDDSHHSSVPDTAPERNTIVAKDISSVSAHALAVRAAKIAAEENQATAVVKVKNAKTLPTSAVQAMTSVGMPVVLQADTLAKNGAVDVRISLTLTKETKEINLAAHTDSPSAEHTRKLFSKYFSNDLTVVSFAQRDNFGQEATVAIRCNPELMEDLVFYSYDPVTNTYQRISNMTYFKDSNGYLHFTTSIAGDIIVTKGLLTSVK